MTEELNCPTCGQPVDPWALMAEAFRRGVAGEVRPKDPGELGPGAVLLLRAFSERMGSYGDDQDQD
jgi:hypothetical protein